MAITAAAAAEVGVRTAASGAMATCPAESLPPITIQTHQVRPKSATPYLPALAICFDRYEVKALAGMR